MPASITLKAVGLNKSPNPLDLAPGSLLQASNVVIRRDGIIEPRRGYQLYGSTFGTSSDRAKQLLTYKQRILVHYSNQLLYDSDGAGTWMAFNGTYLEPQTGRKIRSIESNGNLYFTTSNGIQRVSATSSSAFTTNSGFIQAAGGLKALDVTSRLAITPGNQTGFLTQDSSVAYRVLWGYNDANANLIQGTPSQREVISNPLLSLMTLDMNRLLNAIENVAANSTNVSLINNTDYNQYVLTGTSSATTLRNNLISLATELDSDILYANDTGVAAPLKISAGAISGGVCTITFSVGTATDYFVSGSNISLSGFATGVGTINGAQVVATVTATTITFNTTATGAVTITGTKINSYEYEKIAQPTTPSALATDAQLVALQVYLQAIITRLQSEPSTSTGGETPVISSNSQTNYISALQTTTTANVTLKFTIPSGATTSTFYQIYRSDIALATGTQVLSTDVSPTDELKLVFEGFPTTTDLSNGFVQVTDITPPQFAGAFLYTDETNGQGILQSNDLPPAALDIAKFKNVTFYANTRTRHRESINLLGVINMISDYNAGTTPKFTISDGVTTNTYSFVTGVSQIITATTVADVAGNLASKYFTLNSFNNAYYVWYVVAGVGTDPAISGKTGIKVYLNTNDTANTVASKTSNAVAIYTNDFIVSVLNNVVTITNTAQGTATAPTNGTSGFTTATTTTGRGENAAAKQILLSTLVSPAQAVDATARSIVRVINANTSELVYAFYLSGATSVPGKMLFEERTLGTNPFFVLGNDSNTGTSFDPVLTPSTTISSNTIANPTVITTAAPHGMLNQDQVMITNSNSTPSIDGMYTITYISTTTFSINVNVTVGGTTGSIIPVATAVTSNNEVLHNRLYYSKTLQPDAVPIVNTMDIGAKDKAILRIFPLKDTLFVFKEDGLFRISGEQAPFNLALFDSSCLLLAPDSLDASNNLIYGWTKQGIQQVSEANVITISRPIDIDILKLPTSQYTNFVTSTWGIGYESDNSYTVYTIASTTDTVAQIGYRYSTLTNTWTTFTKTNTCGIINPADDTQYLAAGDTDSLEQERKNFDRTDYADRALAFQLTAGNYYGSKIQLSTVSTVSVGDVVTQDQYLTVFGYNSILKKLDTDATLSPHTYTTNLTMVAGNDPRIKLDALITQIANDAGRIAQPGFTSAATYTAFQAINGTLTINSITASNPTVITTSTNHGLQSGRVITISGSNSVPTINGTYVVTVLTPTTFTIPVSVKTVGTTGSFSIQNNDFRDIQSSYNSMITTLNNDTGVAFGNYASITNDTLQEAIILSIDSKTKKVTLNNTLDFVVGPITIYKAIQSTIQWAPQTFGDPLNLKHVREATLMFETKAFTNATLSFASDLLPAFLPVPVNGTGNGIFGSTSFGYSFFGGASNSAPFRTYVPRDVQRCRYLNCQYQHQTGREKYSITGLTLTGEINQSSRAYR